MSDDRVVVLVATVLRGVEPAAWKDGDQLGVNQ